MTMLGLTFVGQGFLRATQSRWEHERRVAQRTQRAEQRRRAMSLHVGKSLTDQEREVLDTIAAQLTPGERVPSRRRCPECQRNMTLVRLGGVTLDACTLCRGCWFDPGELRFISGLSRDVPGEALKSRPSRYRCPVCQAEMTEHVFIKPFNLLVDQCHRHGVYLEDRELERVFRIT